MKRPFAPMKALDMEEVIEDIIKKIKWERHLQTCKEPLLVPNLSFVSTNQDYVVEDFLEQLRIC